MMSWITELNRYNAERHRLIQLKHELDHLSSRLSEETAGLKTSSDEFQRLISHFGDEAGLVAAEMAEIETRQIEDRAERWQIPIPQRPYGSGRSNELWDWNHYHGRFYLTAEAKRDIRRQIYEEREMRTKPIITWAALGLSIISLIVSALKP